ncbi:MAG TPA: serine/threonine-protein kinase [Urbifossiella sp.]|nr:serine/threonine-protein kinase [Urbifossiella sp.]
MSPPPDVPDPNAATVARPPAGDAPAPPDGWQEALTAPGLPRPGESGLPSGLALVALEQWIERNRDRIDVGEFKLLERIGTGAFGSVWEGQNFYSGERVAVKFLTAGDDRWEAMLGEVKHLLALEGTGGIVTVKQVHRGNANQPPHYVMPLANAGSLAGVVAAAKPTTRPGESVVPVAEAVRVFTRVAEALAAVHRRGIHHCDLKPNNVLLHRTDPGQPPQPLIADFGQAQLAGESAPALGTFFYMPPDQADAALKKARSDSSWDVYALGAMMYELLVGEPPRREDAILKSIRGTEHLATKLAAYRDGVTAAAKPTAHRKLVDPLLADVIDRCLSTDPGERPRDAGQVVERLKQRVWWRQVRGPLAVGAAATLVFVLLIAGVSALAARDVSRKTTADVKREIDGSLTRTAWYGKAAVERTLQEHVAFVEHHAAAVPDHLRARLALAAGKAAADGPDAIPHRSTFDSWAADVMADAKRRWPTTAGRSVAVVLVAGDTPAGGPARGYTLTRADGESDPVAERAAKADNYRTDWSYRDYFNGVANDFERKDKAHPVVRLTNVSHTYQSRRDGTWRVEVVTPVWSEGGPAERRVVALLSVSLHVDEHLRKPIDMPDSELREGQEVAKALGAYVVNDRGRWVWHEHGMEHLANEAKAGRFRDPDDLTALARAEAARRGMHPDELVPWASADAGMTHGEDRYTDPVALAAGKDAPALLAHTLLFHPYQHSTYPGLKDRAWGFVVQVPEEVAFAPVEELKINLVRAGSILFAALAALALGLWGWLFRLLRGWEFAGQG